MPLPFILAGAAIAFGLGQGMEALSNRDRRRQAEDQHNHQKELLEKTRSSCLASFERLGRSKVEVRDTEMRQFAVSFAKLKNVSLTDVPSMGDFPQDTLEAMEKVATNFAVDPEVIGSSLAAGGAAGLAAASTAYVAVGALGVASTGAAISGLSGAAATSATLAWFGGGALSAGGLGMAIGTAALGSIVAGPAIAIGSMVLNNKYKDDLDKIAEATEQMKTMEAKTSVIQSRADQMDMFLGQLREPLHQSLPQLETIVDRETDWRQLYSQEQEAVAVTTSVAYLISQLIHAPLVDAEGKAVEETKELLENIEEFLRKHSTA